MLIFYKIVLYICVYSKQVPWPAHVSQLAFYRKFIKDSKLSKYFKYFEEVEKLADAGNDSEALKIIEHHNLIQKDFVAISVRNNLKGVAHYQDKPSFNFNSFIGNIGAVSNLWTGVTFFTFIEIFDFILNLLNNCCSKPKSQITEMKKIDSK